MIIFYNKNTGVIHGMVAGRVHNQEEIDTSMIKPQEVAVEDISKYVVSFKRLTKIVEEDIFEDQVDRLTFKIIKNVKVGTRKVEVGAGMEMDDPFKEFFTQVESGTLNLYKHKFVLGSEGQVQDVVAI